MPKKGKPQKREHPWFEKNGRRLKEIEAGRRKESIASKMVCPACGTTECSFGECDGRDF